ncbi:MAG: FkbM family methyltransferase [Halioglobus sp.]
MRTLTHPIFIRSVEEDIGSIINNIFREEYGQMPRHFTPQLIVDAGAYIGDTSAYFLSRYPKASVLSLEPNPESYEIASRNLSDYGERVNLLNAALTPEDGRVRISGLATGARVSTDGQDVAAITITTLLSNSGFMSIDILKMDIEGHEVPVLTEKSEYWLPRVKWLLLETHGKNIEDELLPFLKGKGFTIHRHRNVWYCENRKYLSS